MQVSLLYFDGCPNWQLAEARLRAALERVSRSDLVIEYRNVATPEQAEAEQFRGSPTLLIDGRDPFAACGGEVGLSCQVYRTPEGLAGSPTVEQLVEVLQ
jgi:hypothetical protein